jgi:hypothetical protein
MTVCKRPVASWKPQSVGDSGLDRVGTRKTGVKVPPPTPGFRVAAGRLTAGDIEQRIRAVPARVDRRRGRDYRRAICSSRAVTGRPLGHADRSSSRGALAVAEAVSRLDRCWVPRGDHERGVRQRIAGNIHRVNPPGTVAGHRQMPAAVPGAPPHFATGGGSTARTRRRSSSRSASGDQWQCPFGLMRS